MHIVYNNTLHGAFIAAFSISFIGLTSPAFAQVATTDSQVAVVEMSPRQVYASRLQEIFADGGRKLLAYAAFYQARNYAPIWADGNSKTMLALLTAIEQVPHHGLPMVRYNTAHLEALWAAGNAPEGMAALEAAAAQTYVKFAQEMSSGLLDPRTIHEEMNATRRVAKPADILTDVASATDKVALYRTLQPSTPEYAQMLDLKKELEALIASNGWGPTVASGRTMRRGQSNTRVAALRQRLSMRGYGVSDLTSSAYDDGVIAAVKAFQTDYGLNADGLVGPQTLVAINAQPDGRLKQVIVNLERLRWVNYDLGSRHVYVNIPDFTASVMDNGSATLGFRVVVGTSENQTVEFSDTMTHLIANPTWHVPYSIASQEYLPELQADPTVLVRNNIQMRVRGSGQLVDSTAIDFSQFTEDNFPFDLKQRPSNNNALGRVKFMFPNKFNIYLHDTPAKSLFSKDARAFSHGCVRVQKPMEFAYTLLSLQETDPQAVFNAALNSGEETQIDLLRPVPVHIVYRTAWVDSAGEAQFRHDIYGRDVMVFDALVDAGVTLAALGR